MKPVQEAWAVLWRDFLADRVIVEAAEQIMVQGVRATMDGFVSRPSCMVEWITLSKRVWKNKWRKRKSRCRHIRYQERRIVILLLICEIIELQWMSLPIWVCWRNSYYYIIILLLMCNIAICECIFLPICVLPIVWERAENINKKMGGEIHSTGNLWSIQTIVWRKSNPLYKCKL